MRSQEFAFTRESGGATETEFTYSQESLSKAMRTVGSIATLLSAEVASLSRFAGEVFDEFRIQKEDVSRDAVRSIRAAEAVEPIGRIHGLVEKYSTEIRDLDKAIRRYMPIAVEIVRNYPDRKTAVCGDFAAVSMFVQGIEQMSGSLRRLVENLDTSISMSSMPEDTASAIKQMKQAVTTVREAALIATVWSREIRESPVDCTTAGEG